jgi:hypothetical protein
MSTSLLGGMTSAEVRSFGTSCFVSFGKSHSRAWETVWSASAHRYFTIDWNRCRILITTGVSYSTRSRRGAQVPFRYLRLLQISLDTKGHEDSKMTNFYANGSSGKSTINLEYNSVRIGESSKPFAVEQKRLLYPTLKSEISLSKEDKRNINENKRIVSASRDYKSERNKRQKQLHQNIKTKQSSLTAVAANTLIETDYIFSPLFVNVQTDNVQTEGLNELFLDQIFIFYQH